MTTKVDPCASPAYVEFRSSLTFPNMDSALEAMINTAVGAASDGELTYDSSSNELVYDAQINVGGAAKSISLPFAWYPQVMTAVARISFSLSGNIEELRMTVDVDVCVELDGLAATAAGLLNLGTSFCGANLPSEPTLDLKSLFANPPYEIVDDVVDLGIDCPASLPTGAVIGGGAAAAVGLVALATAFFVKRRRAAPAVQLMTPSTPGSELTKVDDNAL
jgi:uncharacterized protein involved in outer membrane biogenesis